jgi:hypothetical protein
MAAVPQDGSRFRPDQARATDDDNLHVPYSNERCLPRSFGAGDYAEGASAETIKPKVSQSRTWYGQS